jgi:hypothetical protein
MTPLSANQPEVIPSYQQPCYPPAYGQSSYSVQYPYQLPYQQGFGQPAPATRRAPGLGLVFAVLGGALCIASLAGVPWASGVNYSDLYKANKDLPNPSDTGASAAHSLLAGGAIGYAIIGAVLVGALWITGLVSRQNAGYAPRPRPLLWTRIIFCAVQAFFIAALLYGFLEAYKNHLGDAEAGPWLLLAGTVSMLGALAVGPVLRRGSRVERPGGWGQTSSAW